MAATSLVALLKNLPVPALAQGETDVPFTDLPKNFNPSGNPNAATRQLDIRKIDGMLTPKDQFFTTQHFTKPEIDPAKYRLKFTGMVNKPAEFTLADLKTMKSTEEWSTASSAPATVLARFRDCRLVANLPAFV